MHNQYIKCNACYSYITSHDGSIFQKRNKRQDSFAYGLKIPFDAGEDFFEGKGRKWVRFKSRLKKHYSGEETATADIHCRGLQFLDKLERKKSAKFEIHETFVCAALQCVKGKMAAQHFETVLAYYEFRGLTFLSFVPCTKFYYKHLALS